MGNVASKCLEVLKATKANHIEKEPHREKGSAMAKREIVPTVERPGLLIGRRWPELIDWPSFPAWPERMLHITSENVMKIEEFVEDDTMVIKAELPGIDPDKDVEINVADGTLTIRAERRQESKIEEKGRFQSEFSYGAFSRVMTLPTGATEKDIRATYKDGILEIRVPINKAEAESHTVQVQRG